MSNYVKYSKAVVFFLSLTVCIAATAEPVYDVFIGSGPIGGVLNGETHSLKYTGIGHNRTVSVNYGGNTKNTYAGEIIYTYDDVPGRITWCVDIYQTVSSSSKTYDMAEVGDQQYLDAIDKLFYQYTQYAGSLAGNASALDTAAAAFQLTLWEATFETAGEYDMTAGWFSASANGIVDLAQTWLDNLDNVESPEYEKEFLVNSQLQDQLILGEAITPSVPEPLTMTCVGLSLAGIGGYIRKRLRDR